MKKWLIILALGVLPIAAWGVLGGKPSRSAESVVITGESATTPDCPDLKTLVETGEPDRENLMAVLLKIIPHLYADPRHEGYVVGTVKTAPEAGVRGEMVAHWCGPEVAKRTWVVMLTFPKFAPSASMSTGLFWVSKTKQAWHVWYRYC